MLSHFIVGALLSASVKEERISSGDGSRKSEEINSLSLGIELTNLDSEKFPFVTSNKNNRQNSEKSFAQKEES